MFEGHEAICFLAIGAVTFPGPLGSGDPDLGDDKRCLASQQNKISFEELLGELELAESAHCHLQDFFLGMSPWTSVGVIEDICHGAFVSEPSVLTSLLLLCLCPHWCGNLGEATCSTCESLSV